MQAKKQAEFLSKNYGFNVIPMLSLIRDDEGKKIVRFEEGYTRYRGERYNLEDWPVKSDNLAIITGEISNLTIIDIDSKEALRTLENTTNIALEDMASYIIQTTKGYQLFYTYENNMKSKTGIQQYIDLLNDGKQTFADPVNDGYKLLKGSAPQAMPDKLRDLFKVENTKLVKVYLGAMQEENTLTFKNPLCFLLEDYINAKRLTSKIIKPLEKRFCTGDFQGLTFEELTARKGRLHDLNLYVAEICAADPTVDEKLYYEFLHDFAKRTIKTDRTYEQLNAVGGFDWAYDTLYDYNPKWQEKHEQVGSTKAITSQAEIKIWYDPEEDKYYLYDLKTNHIDKYSKPSFKDAYKRHTGQDIDVEEVQAVYSAFEPQINDQFFIGNDGRHFHNSFQRTPIMEYFLEAKPRKDLPPFIGAILHNVFPVKEHRELFLHNLAYHLKHITYGNTLFLSAGATQGTGKNLLYDGILKLIYGKYHLTWETDHFTATFNGQLKNKLIVHGNDIKEKSSLYATKTLGNVVKANVANPTLNIQAKGKETEEVANYVMFVMSSNEHKPFTVDEGENRRLNVFPTSKTKLEDYYKDTPPSQSGIVEKLENEIRPFVEYLAGIKLKPEMYKKDLDTELRQVMVGKSTPSSHKIAQAMLDKDLVTLDDECEEDFVDFYKHEIIDLNISYIKANTLKAYLPQQRKAITDYFKTNGVDWGNQGIPREKKSGIIYIINPKGTKQEELKLGGPKL